jgi:hypothetical protein
LTGPDPNRNHKQHTNPPHAHRDQHNPARADSDANRDQYNPARSNSNANRDQYNPAAIHDAWPNT